MAGSIPANAYVVACAQLKSQPMAIRGLEQRAFTAYCLSHPTTMLRADSSLIVVGLCFTVCTERGNLQS
jgi:hypothetical protein